MDNHKIIRLTENPELKDRMALWFHQKWSVPLEAYIESMNACLRAEYPVPQWYAAMEEDKIIGGIGVIENDFHERKDLTPNVCAVYVEKEYRRRGIAGELLHFVCNDMKQKGIDMLYLLTDHQSFYERYGWKFLCMARGDGESSLSRLYIHQ